MVKFLLFFISTLYALTGCSQKQSHTNNGGGSIVLASPKEFTQQLNTEKGVLLDVRTPAEWEKGHLTNAILADISGDSFDAEILKLDTNTTVYVYCASGRRSANAAVIMQQKGFRKVVDLDGGIKRWANEGMPIEQ
ncbi:MAG: rhodanese-like domain-containing protein [Bacteroidota bacterium]